MPLDNKDVPASSVIEFPRYSAFLVWYQFNFFAAVFVLNQSDLEIYMQIKSVNEVTGMRKKSRREYKSMSQRSKN